MRNYLTLFTEAGFAPTNLEYNARQRTQGFQIRLLSNFYNVVCSDGGKPFISIIGGKPFNVENEPPSMSHIIDFIIQECRA